MRKWFILAIVVLSVAGFFLYRSYKKEEKNEWEAELRKAKSEVELKRIKEKSEWIQSNMDFEFKMIDLYMRMGYSFNAALDSIRAAQDRRYLVETISNDPMRRDWYIEYRKRDSSLKERYKE